MFCFSGFYSTYDSVGLSEAQVKSKQVHGTLQANAGSACFAACCASTAGGHLIYVLPKQ